jgi:hypothetical protein
MQVQDVALHVDSAVSIDSVHASTFTSYLERISPGVGRASSPGRRRLLGYPQGPAKVSLVGLELPLQ